MNTDPKVNVLLVDNEPANLIALEATLEYLGQNLVKAYSGTEALRYVLDQDFAVILLDVQMPGLNGIETAALIRERERSRHIPIIFLTGAVKTAEMMFKGYSAGAVDYLMKPIVSEVLRAKVEVFVELAQARQKLQEEIVERARVATEIDERSTWTRWSGKRCRKRSRTCQAATSSGTSSRCPKFKATATCCARCG